ncbi:MAG: uncharacterized protein QG567_1232 [Campylobacterota bacterium]|nr:uncharacterized protein [Campylobacterota bacterium]
MEAIELISIITIAFLGSFGHCIGMCGGIVIAYTNAKIGDDWSRKKEIAAHVLYSFGRIFTYAVLGAIFGYLGSVVKFGNDTNGILFVIAGVVMILAGLSLMGKMKFLSFIEHSVSNSGWYRSSFRKFLSSKSLYSFFVIGVLNGLLPCGFVYFFAITAASTASPFYGAVVMMIFGLSTIPALLSLGLFAGLLKKIKFRNIMMTIASILVVGYGLLTVYKGYSFITKEEPKCHNCG